MKKLYIPLVSIIFCMQQTQSMELTVQQPQNMPTMMGFKDFCIQQKILRGDDTYQRGINQNNCHKCNSTLKMNLTTPSNNDDGYTIITKNIADLPTPTPILKEFDELSEKLYTDTITYTEIQELVTKGAHLNYQKRGWNGPIVFDYANDNSLRSVKNMETAIGLKAAIHNIKDEEHTPLTIALEINHFLEDEKKDFSAMIQLLIPHEDPIVTIYEKTEDRNGKSYTWITYSQEQNIREYLISCSCLYPNPTTIKMLLDLKLMTANRGLRTFAHSMKPNKEILDLFITYGANNSGDLLPKVMYNTFPFDQYIEFMRQMCAAKAFNKEVLKRMETIEKDVSAIVSYLKSNEPK